MTQRNYKFLYIFFLVVLCRVTCPAICVYYVSSYCLQMCCDNVILHTKKTNNNENKNEINRSYYVDDCSTNRNLLYASNMGPPTDPKSHVTTNDE